MKNLWSDADAKRMVAAYAKQNVSRDLALRVYTTRLLGNDPRLVLHGGGNTSVKTTATTLTGEIVEVLCVKGSGWDMGDIEPAGLPAVQLEPLKRLRDLKSLSDEEMVNAQRCNLLDSTSPNPSVETLLHAFLPHTFVDHTHSTAVLALTDQPNGEKICREVYGRKMGIVPYIMPGFALAKKAAEVYEADPSVEGLVLLKHGIFTFGATAEEAYSRMISMVSKAEARLKKNRRKVFASAALPKKLAQPSDILPILRGLMALPVNKDEGQWKRFVFDLRTSPAILNYVNGRDVGRYSQVGVATPDHTIRTKNWPMLLPAPEVGKLEAFREEARAALHAYAEHYHAYFARHNKRHKGAKKELDALPRVILVPGLGLFGLGASKKDAKIAADIAVNTVETITDAEAIGRYECVSEADMFDCEYWSLEQAKLGKAAEKPLARQICVVTGGGSGIGAATARAFARQGCEVAVLDRDGKAAEAVAKTIGGLGLACDVTNGADVARAFAQIAAAFGGVDILVSNAGAAWQGRIGEVDEKVVRDSFELNFWAHQKVAQAATRIMRTQGLGGCLLFNTSKQAVNPGPDFGPYGLPKAATLFLMRQYAVDHGADGIRANAVNADRIRTGLLTDDMVKKRSKARGVSEKDYMSGNLLGREVTAEDVAQEFVALALAHKTTGAVITVDGGNIAAALR